MNVPEPTVARLPLYHRALAELVERGVATASSADMAASLGVNAATLRRDLSHLGSLGLRGTGYDVPTLLASVRRALALDREWPIAICGAGHLGLALARSEGFNTGRFRVACLFDVDPGKVGMPVGGPVVRHLDELAVAVEQDGIAIGVIATPAAAAQDVATRLAAAGVRALVNFAPVVLQVPPGTRVRQVDLSAELEVLAHYGARRLAGVARETGGSFYTR
jgi:redox-sensing transcriptional repressor